MTPEEIKNLTVWIALNVTKEAAIEKESPRRWQARYGIGTKTDHGVVCGGFKSEAEAIDYLWYQIGKPLVNKADAMLVLEKCAIGRTIAIRSVGEKCWIVFNSDLENESTMNGESETLPIAIAQFAKQLFTKASND